MDSQRADHCRKILKNYWGYDDFRGIQWDIIDSVCNGNDTLGLMPTGGGKSVTFQVPALAYNGMCLVVSPLISLMKDQVDSLRAKHIRAATVYGDMTHSQMIATLDTCIFGGIKILYVSPERLSSEIFLEKLNRMPITLIAVDEAHCISQWGYDFRPSYLNIASLRKMMPSIPILALTATATPTVIDDIQEKLAFRHPNVFRMSFARDNLAYIVREAEQKDLALLDLLKSTQGSAIVYTRTRRQAKDLALWLNKNGISAAFYHAVIDDSDKNLRQRAWQANMIRVIVATNAFGMGIDKPDVRLVVHYGCPESVEAYFQEAGRAGRDGKSSQAIMLYNAGDILTLKRHLTDRFPKKEVVKQVYGHLASFFQIAAGSGANMRFNFNMDKFCHNFHYYPTTVTAALEILRLSGYLDYSFDNVNMSRVRFTLGRDSLYRLRGNNPEEETVIESLLRLYTGLFIEETSVDEALLAQYCSTDAISVKKTLVGLSKKGILRYIPSANIPYIIYNQSRAETKRIVITRQAYEQRFERMLSRTTAMIDYVTSTNKCRSKMLLDYFGEKSAKPCGVCDVCLSRRQVNNG